jgi:hypothetical protein|nr:MAG TPA: Putative conjugative transposon recombinase [Caudoviricetes sp.]
MRKKLRVAGYARVSTDEQKKYGYSIQAQVETPITPSHTSRKKHTMPFRLHYKPIYAQEYNAMYIYSLDC